MEKIQIKVQTRDINTKKADTVRDQGRMPAELYGHNISNLHLSVDQNEFEKVLRQAGESTIIGLLFDDGKTRNVLIHGVQRHYLTNKPIHVDFYEVSMTEKLTAAVSLEFIGEAPAVKVLGGVMVKVLDEVEVQCLPADLPHNIPVDISVLKTLNNTILVKDLPVPPKVTLLTPGDEMVVKVQPPRNIEAELEAPVVEDVSKVEGAAEDVPEAAEEGEAEAKDKVKEKDKEKK
jgi:large subunit ribosomal protein L25